MNKIVDVVSRLADPVAQKLGLRLWDVEYVKEAGQWFLRVYIDRDGGVSIEQCEAVSREMDPLLDELDVIPGSYTFEVSSAGAERALKRPSDFEKFIGRPVYLKLYKSMDGEKEFLGNLAGYENGDVEIEDDGKSLRFSKDDIALVRLRIV